MHSRLQTRIQRYGWDKATPHYENGWQASLALVQERLLEIANPQSGEHVVDMAAGTGLVTLPIAEAIGPNGHMIATDISTNMLSELQARAKTRGFTQVETLRADSEALDAINGGAFDLVTCSLGLMYFPDPMNALKQAWRLLKPGGRAVFSVWGARKNCGWADIFPIVDARVNSDVCPMFFRLGTQNVLAMEAGIAGFDNIVEQRINTELPFPGDEAALGAAFAGGPVALAYDRFDEEARRSAHEAYLASIETFKTQGEYKIPGEFVIVSARKSHSTRGNE